VEANKAVQTEHVTGSFQPRSGQEFAAELYELHG